MPDTYTTVTVVNDESDLTEATDATEKVDGSISESYDEDVRSATFGNIDVTLTKNDPPGFNPTVREIREAAEYELRGKEAGMINENSGSSVVIRQNGQINLSSTKFSSYKLSPTGKSIEQTLESNAITNRRRITCNDFIINEHKLNPYLYELTDMKEVNLPTNDSVLVGNFCVLGTVLTKSWEQDLKRYVLIRRLARMPMFSPLLNVPDIQPGLQINDPLKVDPKILGVTEAGYHVNMVISDSESRIGKEGVDREGIDRNAWQEVGNGTVPDGGASSSTGGSSTGSISGNDTQDKCWIFFVKNCGFTDEGAAGIMGNIAQECSYKENLVEGGKTFSENSEISMQYNVGYGLIQWSDPDLKKKWIAMSEKMGKPCVDIEVQFAAINEIIDDRKVRNYFKSANNIEDAVLTWHAKVEISADRNMDNRNRYAHEAYDKYHGKDLAQFGYNSGSPGGGTSQGGDNPLFNGFDNAVTSYLTGGEYCVAAMFPEKSTDMYLYNNKSIESASLIKIFIASECYAANKGVSDVYLMIQHSDNGSTNRCIDALGGVSAANALINAKYPESKLQRKMLSQGPDNYTSVKDQVNWWYKLYKNEFTGSAQIKQAGYDQYDYVPRQYFDSKGWKTCHKTGEHPNHIMFGDSGFVTGTSNGVMIYAIIGKFSSSKNGDTVLGSMSNFWSKIIK